METLKSLLVSIFVDSMPAFDTGFGTIFAYKLLVSIPLAVLVIFWRFVLANIIHVKRHDKQDWIVWGIVFALQIATCFIAVPSIWGIVQFLILAFIVAYTLFFDKARKIRSIIYNSNVIYTEHEKEGKQETELKKFMRKQDNKIVRRFSIARTHMKMGIPVLYCKFVFKVNPTASEEELSRVVAHFNRFFDGYNWRRQKASNGIKYEFACEAKIDKVNIVPFNKKLSDALEWYSVPMGAVDVSTKQTIEETPYIWLMHDPKTEGKHFRELDKTRLFTPSPMAFIAGSTGGGKSVCVNGIIAHFVNKAKQDRQTELYLCDAKQVEFKPYEALEEVKQVALKLEDAVKLTDEFCKQMHMRNTMMSKEGIDKIPLNGHIKLKRNININGTIIYGSDIIEFKTQDGKIHKDRALNLDGRTDIIEINMPEPEKPEKEEKDERRAFW